MTEHIKDENYKVNVGGRRARGLVVYHINILREYKRSILFISGRTVDTGGLEEASPCSENETIDDLDLRDNLDQHQRQELRNLHKFSQINWSLDA